MVGDWRLQTVTLLCLQPMRDEYCDPGEMSARGRQNPNRPHSRPSPRLGAQSHDDGNDPNRPDALDVRTRIAGATPALCASC